MAIPKNKLDGGKDRSIIEVINVKISPEEGKKICGTAGIYPAWHMNKKSWVSLLLDDTLPDGQIMEFLKKVTDWRRKRRTGQKRTQRPIHGSSLPIHITMTSFLRLKRRMLWNGSRRDISRRETRCTCTWQCLTLPSCTAVKRWKSIFPAERKIRNGNGTVCVSGGIKPMISHSVLFPR